jgi:hypothetical protein
VNISVPLLLIWAVFSPVTCSAIFKFRSINSALKVGSSASLNAGNPLTYTSGTLELVSPSTTTLSGDNNSLTFSKSLFKSGTNTCFLSANLDPTATEAINLQDGNFLFFEATSTLFQPVAVAAAATVTIAGSVFFGSAISLGSAASTLRLNISNVLTQNVSGSGTLKLLGDLILGSGIGLPSLLNLSGNRLTMLGGTYAQSLTVSGAGIIHLGGATTLSAAWTIGTSGENYTLSGSGNVLDLGSAGSLVFNGTSLTISNLVIKGLTSNLLRGTGEIKLSNVTLILSGNYTRSDGKISVVGSNCKIITNGYTFSMSGAGNDLKIDGSYLFYEQLNSTIQTSPISVVSSAAITKLNGGDVIAVGGGSGATAGIGSIPMVVTNATQVLDRDYPVTATGTFQVNNAVPGTPLAVAIDGAGHFLSFPQKLGSYFILQDNVQLTLSNTVVKDFYPAAISFGTSSTLAFGDGARIELGQDLTIGAADPAWAFSGNAEIDGNGAMLTINKSGGITVTGGKTLTLKNMTIIAGVVDCIKALTDSDHVKFQDIVFVVQSAGFKCSTGYIDIANFVKLTGNLGTSLGQVNFEFASKGYLTILANAELFVDTNINLKYNANPANDITTYASKRHFVFGKQTSVLTLFGCSLESTATGLALDTGILNVRERVTLTSSTSPGAAFEFCQNLQTNMGVGAILNVVGPVRYQEP